MLTALRTESTRLLHLTIIALQIFSVAQVIWWFIDQQTFAQQTSNQVKMLYSYNIVAAQKLADLGVAEGEVATLFPYTQFLDGRARLAAGTIEALENERRRHVNQYAWESGFFLLVLASCIAVLWRGLNNETNIRRRQDNFLAMVSHQFKTPLASLQLSIETMLIRGLSTERFQQLSQRMLGDLRRMENMVSKILDSARFDRGRVYLSKERLNLSEAVRHVTSNIEELALRENIKILIDVSPELEIFADPMAVDTVLRNLAENAIAAMVPARNGSINVSARKVGGSIELEVRDTGVGFEPKQASKLFNKFFRIESHGGRDATGTGLGLFIVQRFMHFENGKIQAHSEGQGRGAVFTVTWRNSQDQVS